MKFTIFIDQIHALEWGLNLQQAAVFDYLYSISSWADAQIIEGEVFYFASRFKVIEQFPLISDKPDTIYRIYKHLFDVKVIDWFKWNGKDMVRLTEKGKQWNSEKNPNELFKLGKKSELTRKKIRIDSEKNPTYNTTSDSTINDETNIENADLFSPTIIYDPEVGAIVHDPMIAANDSFNSDIVQRKENSAKEKKGQVGAEFIAQVISHLNAKTNRKEPSEQFKPTTKTTIQDINSRVNIDKWTLEDFIAVIDFKVAEWGKNDKMRHNLCPSTLFRACHAEKYLMAARSGVLPSAGQKNTGYDEKTVYAGFDHSKAAF